jgi:hypothetical protein
MRVSTPGRQSSGGIDVGSLTFMELALSRRGYCWLRKQTVRFRASQTRHHSNDG